MQVRITVINVDIEQRPGQKGKKGYEQAEVTYKDGDGTRSKKIMSFANPQVFATLKDAQKGDQFDVTSEKIGEYWQWTAISPAGAGSPDPVPARSSNGASSGSVGRSNFETPEERAARQRLIVRQSSLTAALGTLTPGAKAALDPDAVEALAERYHDWVYQKPDLFDEPSDIPF